MSAGIWLPRRIIGLAFQVTRNVALFGNFVNFVNLKNLVNAG